jgi:hypothetical protein
MITAIMPLGMMAFLFYVNDLMKLLSHVPGLAGRKASTIAWRSIPVPGFKNLEASNFQRKYHGIFQ